MLRRVVFALPALLATSSVLADHPSFSLDGGLTGPTITQPALTLTRGSWSAGLRLEYIEFEPIPDESLRARSEEHQHVHGVDALWGTSLTLGYGFSDDLTLGLSLPYIKRTEIREAAHVHGVPDDIGELGDSEGVGDARLFGQYRFYRSPVSEMHAAAIFGLKAPTGKTDERTADGVRFGTDLQPGSGSWDPFAGLAYSRKWKGFSLHGNVLYMLSTEGAQDTELGDGVFYNFALAYPLSGGVHRHEHQADDHHPQHKEPMGTAWSVMLELNGEWRGKDETEEGEDDNTGGNLIYLAPGIRANVGDRWTAVLSVGFPVLTDLNGTQNEPELRVIGSVSVGF